MPVPVRPTGTPFVGPPDARQSWLRPWLTSTFDWLFMAAANIFVLFCLFLVISPYGKIRIGGVDDVGSVRHGAEHTT